MRYWSLPLLAAVISHIALGQEGVVTIRCVDESGTPVAGARLSWMAFADGEPTVFPGPESQAVADANGVCVVDFRSHRRYERNNFEVRATSDQLVGEVRVYPRGKDEKPPTITLASPVTISGHIRDENGDGLEGAVVGTSWFPLDTTSGDGRFSVNLPRIGGDEISVFKEGYVPVQVRPEGGELSIALRTGRRVQVAVVDTNGSPIADANVWYKCDVISQNELKSDATGMSETLPLPIEGELTVYGTARTNGGGVYGEMTHTVGAEAGQRVVLTLAERKSEDFVTISGRVLLSGTEEPVKADLVMYQRSYEFEYYARSWGSTEPDGTFTIDRRLRRGKYYLRVRPADKKMYAVDGVVEVDASAGSVEGLVLYAAPGCMVHGRAVVPDGEALKPAFVYLSQQGYEQRMVTMGERGMFVFPNLPPTPARVTLSIDGEHVRVELPGPGKAVTHVQVPMRGMSERAYIVGDAVDEDGKPLVGVEVDFSIEVDGKSVGNASGRTGNDGRFRAESMRSGTALLRGVRTWRQIVLADEEVRRNYECAVLTQPEPFPLKPGETVSDVHIVARMPDVTILLFAVADDAGEPLTPSVEIWTADDKRPVDPVGRTGTYAIDQIPDEPFALMFQTAGYQARLLQVDRDFQRGDDRIPVTLIRGSFPDEEERWTAITGTQNTQEAVDATTRGGELRGDLDRLAALAQPPKQVPVREQEVKAPLTVAIHVTDPAGEPVTRITIQGTESYGGALPVPGRIELVLPSRDAAIKILSSEDGHFVVPNGSIVQSNGSYRRLVSVADGDEQVDVVLGPAQPITIKLSEAGGGPATGRSLLPAPVNDYLYSTPSAYTYSKLFAVDGNGMLTLRDYPPGDYAFAVATGRQEYRFEDYVYVHHEGNGPTEVVATVGPWPEDSPEARLEALLARDRSISPASLEEKWSALAAVDREAIGLAAKRRLNVLRLADDRRIYGIARVVGLAGMEDAVPALKDMMRQPTPEGFLGFEERAFAFAVADIQGDDAVPFLEVVASDASYDAAQRIAAVMALGRIGTEASVAAWKRLRDAAREHEGAPEAKNSYTHAERMAEALTYVLHVIPGVGGIPQVSLESAVIEEGHESGIIGAGSVFDGFTTYRLRRFGDEWLVVDVEGTIIS